MRTKEVVVVEVVGGVIQMVVEVVVAVEAEVGTKMAAVNTMSSLETIIQGTTITIEEEEAEVVAAATVTTIMVQAVKFIQLQVMLGFSLDNYEMFIVFVIVIWWR